MTPITPAISSYVIATQNGRPCTWVETINLQGRTKWIVSMRGDPISYMFQDGVFGYSDQIHDFELSSFNTAEEAFKAFQFFHK